MKKTFDTPGPLSVYVELGSGKLTATAVDTTETLVEIVGPRAEDFELLFTGSQLSVIAPHGRIFGRDSHQVHLTVPSGANLATKTGSADLATSGTLGTIKLKTGSGDVELERAEGSVVIESGSGDVKGLDLTSDVRIKSGSGDIDLREVGGAIGISTGSGDVILGVVRADTVVKTGSGDLKVKRAEGDISLTTASGDLTIGAAPRGKVTARNVSGDVRIGVPVGTPVWTDINTVTGSLRNRLAAVGKPEAGQDFVELRATTVSGDVVLEQI